MKNIDTARGFALALALAVMAVPTSADERRDHAPSFDYLFGNHIDTHQRTRLRRDGALSGALLVYFTDEIDGDSGLPVARHPRGAMHNEECGVDVDCLIGWRLRGVRASAKFLFHSGVNGDDHPVWLVDRGTIPQPGGFSHFHWVTSTGTEAARDRLEVPLACDVEMAGELEGTVVNGTLTLDDGIATYGWDQESVHIGDPDDLGNGAENLTCPGWFLELKAVRSFAFRHGGATLPVYPGADNKTHLNLLTNYALVPDIDGGSTGH